MRFSTKTLRLIILGVACTSIGALAVWAGEDADDGEKPVTLEQVPAPVRATIEEQTKGAKDLKVSSETDDGFTVFEAEFESGGVKKSLDLTDAGVVIERESAVSGAAVPKGVTEKILAKHPKAEIKEIQEVVSTYYEVTCLVGGKEHEMKVYANGKEVEEDD